MKTSRFTVTGMSCSACSSHVEKCVSKLKGVSKVSVNLLAGNMQVDYDETVLKDGDIVKAVKKAGYGAKSLEKKESAKESGSEVTGQLKKESDGLKLRLVLSVVFWLLLMYVAMGHMIYEWLHIPMPAWEMNYLHGNENGMIFALLQVLILVPILLLNSKYFTNGFKMLFKKSPNMDSLIAIGSVAAVVYGVFAMFMIAYGLGHNDMDLVETYRKDLYFESAGTIKHLVSCFGIISRRGFQLRLIRSTSARFTDRADKLRIGYLNANFNVLGASFGVYILNDTNLRNFINVNFLVTLNAYTAGACRRRCNRGIIYYRFTVRVNNSGRIRGFVKVKDKDYYTYYKQKEYSANRRQKPKKKRNYGCDLANKTAFFNTAHIVADKTAAAFFRVHSCNHTAI